MGGWGWREAAAIVFFECLSVTELESSLQADAPRDIQREEEGAYFPGDWAYGVGAGYCGDGESCCLVTHLAAV